MMLTLTNSTRPTGMMGRILKRKTSPKTMMRKFNSLHWILMTCRTRAHLYVHSHRSEKPKRRSSRKRKRKSAARPSSRRDGHSGEAIRGDSVAAQHAKQRHVPLEVSQAPDKDASITSRAVNHAHRHKRRKKASARPSPPEKKATSMGWHVLPSHSCCGG